jgi:hypothetical protein
VIAGTVYVPHREERHRAIRTLNHAVSALRAEYGGDAIVLLGDFNTEMEALQSRTVGWGVPLRVLPNEGNQPTWRALGHQPRCIDHIAYNGTTSTTVEPIQVLNGWEVSDHFPVVGKLRGLKGPQVQGDLLPIDPTGHSQDFEHWHFMDPQPPVLPHLVELDLWGGSVWHE